MHIVSYGCMTYCSQNFEADHHAIKLEIRVGVNILCVGLASAKLQSLLLCKTCLAMLFSWRRNIFYFVSCIQSVNCNFLIRVAPDTKMQKKKTMVKKINVIHQCNNYYQFKNVIGMAVEIFKHDNSAPRAGPFTITRTQQLF